MQNQTNKNRNQEKEVIFLRVSNSWADKIKSTRLATFSVMLIPLFSFLLNLQWPRKCS